MSSDEKTIVVRNRTRGVLDVLGTFEESASALRGFFSNGSSNSTAIAARAPVGSLEALVDVLNSAFERQVAVNRANANLHRLNLFLSFFNMNANTRLRTKLEEVSSTVNTLGSEVTKCQSGVNSLENSVGSLQTSLKEHEERTTEIQQQHDSQQSLLEQHAAVLSTQTRALQQLTERSQFRETVADFTLGLVSAWVVSTSLVSGIPSWIVGVVLSKHPRLASLLIQIMRVAFWLALVKRLRETLEECGLLSRNTTNLPLPSAISFIHSKVASLFEL